MGTQILVKPVIWAPLRMGFSQVAPHHDLPLIASDLLPRDADERAGRDAGNARRAWAEVGRTNREPGVGP